MVLKEYVASKSGHSRGSAIDLTPYRLDTDALVPVGSSFDFIDERSHHTSKEIPSNEAENRRILCSIMEYSGFESYVYEWWHYVLKKRTIPLQLF